MSMTMAEYRKIAGVTQAEMAMHMGVPFRTYQDIEAGKVTFRTLHANAARWALLNIAIAKDDASFLPAGIAGIVAGAAALLDRSNSKPGFAAQPLKVGSGWQVLVTWPNGMEEQIPDFSSERDAKRWILNESASWLAKRSAASRLSYGDAAEGVNRGRA